jgi:glycosyltransferase involved in cell wall biosynthesis
MQIAFNGYFWGQPRTGSGQYLRHLWDAIPGAAPGENRLALLLPPGSDSGSDVPRGGRVVRGRQMPLVGGRVAGIDKLAWEGTGVARLAAHVRADVLHVPYLSAPFPAFKSCPVVVTAHDMIPWIVPGYAASAAVKLYLRVAVVCVRRADLIVADSETSRRDVLNVLRMSRRKVRTVYLGMVPHPIYTRGEIAEMKARLGLPENYAFYLGGFDKRKNVPLLLRAWHSALPQLEDAPDKALLAIGGKVPAPGGVFPDTMGEARNLGLDETGSTVRFLGMVSEEDKALIMAGARLFVYPSAYEGFGLDPLEAMSVGCPVVSSSGGSLSEVVGDAGLLVPPDDEKALAEAIVTAWNKPDLRAHLSAKGRLRAGSFTWEKTAEQTLHLYEEVHDLWTLRHG